MAQLIVLILSLGTATYPPGEEPFPFDAAVDAEYQHAFELLEKGDAKGALTVAERVVKDAPENPRAHSLLGQTYVELRRHADADQALTRALALGLDAKRKPSTLSLRSIVRYAQGKKREAEEDARAALSLDIKQPFALFVSAVSAAERGRLDEARQQLESLITVAPAFANAHAVLAMVLAEEGETERAADEARRARSLGTDIRLDNVDDAISSARRTRLAWQLPLASAAFLGLALLLFYAMGTLLSRVEIARLGDVKAHLLVGEQTGGERLVERLYLVVLWFGTLLFYVSVPLLVVLTLAVGFGLLYLVLQLPRIPVQLILILLLAALGGTWAIVRGLFLGRAPERSGRRLGEAEAPALFGALREVAEVARARLVDRVQLEPDANIGVREAGGTLRVLFGRGERVLHLGFGALHGMSVSELKSILAHEYGHFSHGETRLTPVIWRIIGSLVGIVQRMSGLGWSAAINPVFWYLRLYLKVYLSVSAAQSRRRELLADRAAALAYGGDTFARALKLAVENGALFDRVAYELAAQLRETGRPCHDLYRYLAAAQEATPERLRAQRRDQQLGRPPGTYDSHPPPNDRIRRVEGIPGSRRPENAPAQTLFPDAEKLSREVTAEVVRRIDEHFSARGVRTAPAVTVDEAAEERLAAALSLHRDAVELAARDRAAGEPVVERALKELEAEAGSTDLCLVRALTDVSRLRSHLGDRAGAAAVLERALSIVESAPKPDEERAYELRELLNRAKEAA